MSRDRDGHVTCSESCHEIATVTLRHVMSCHVIPMDPFWQGGGAWEEAQCKPGGIPSGGWWVKGGAVRSASQGGGGTKKASDAAVAVKLRSSRASLSIPMCRFLRRACSSSTVSALGFTDACPPPHTHAQGIRSALAQAARTLRGGRGRGRCQPAPPRLSRGRRRGALFSSPQSPQARSLTAAIRASRGPRGTPPLADSPCTKGLGSLRRRRLGLKAWGRGGRP